jgi:hypothetical protein
MDTFKNLKEMMVHKKEEKKVSKIAKALIIDNRYRQTIENIK